jgi:hypothetical protein
MAAAVPASASLLPVSAARPLAGNAGDSRRPTLFRRVEDLFSSAFASASEVLSFFIP